VPSARTPDRPNVVPWPAGETLWRVSTDPTGLAFSTWTGRLNRFSPLYRPDGSVVPAWYGGTTEAGALFESVFHDIRPRDIAPRVLPNAYANRLLVPLETARDLELVDLTSLGLHAIGLDRKRLIETTSSRYPWTIGIAERLRAGAQATDGFAWVSRAHDTSGAVVLYEEPGREPMLRPHPTLLPMALGLGPGLELLRELAVKARITLVVPGA